MVMKKLWPETVDSRRLIDVCIIDCVVAMNEEKFGGGTVKAFCFFLERGISEVDDDTNI